MSQPIKVLLVEDSENDAELTLRVLRQGGFDPTYRCVQSAADLEAALAQESWDAVISDFRMPGFTGMDALRIFRSAALDIPFMLVSGTIMGEEAAVEAMKAGASDYIMKESLSRLAPALERELKQTQMRAAHRRAQDELRRSEGVKGAILTASLDCLITIDQEGKIVEFNPAAETTFGWAREQVLGKEMVELIVPPRLRDAHRRGFARFLATGIGTILGKRLELEAIRADGTEFPIELAITAIGAASTPMFTGFIRDITARKEAEGKINRLNRVYAVLSGINTLIVRVRDRNELFREACRITVQDGQFPFAWIGTLDPADQDVTPVAWAGESADELTRARSSARDDVPAGKGAVGRAIRERRTIVNHDIVARDFGGPRLNEILRLGFRSQITLPLYDGQAVLGTLTMYAREPNFFDDEELRLLTELAGNISFALENISRQQKLDKLARVRAVSSEIDAAIVRIHDRETLLRETCRITVERGKFPLVWIALLNPEKREVRPIAWEGFSAETALAVDWTGISAPGAMLEEAIQTRQLVMRHDIEAVMPTGSLRREAVQHGCRSSVCLPFVIDDSVVAAAVLFATGRGFFDNEEIALLKEVAGNISFALEHIQKEEKIARLSRIEAVMGSINALIVRVCDRQELFDGACRIAVEHGNFRITWIGTLDPQTLDVTPVACAGLGGKEFLGSIKLSARSDDASGQGIVGQAIRERKTAFSNDGLRELGTGTQVVRLGDHSRIALPLLAGGDVVGIIVLIANGKDFFTEEELELLNKLAGNISFAVENLAKQKRLDKLARIRAVSSEINAAIIRIHYHEALLSETCRIAVEHGKFELVWIALIDQVKQEVQPVAWAGFSPEAAHAVSWSSISGARGTLGEAILTRKPAVRHDVAAELGVGKLRQEALAKGSHSVVSLPLAIDNTVVGLIVLYARGVGFFDEEELRLLTDLAGNISFALENISRQQKLDKMARVRAVSSEINAAIIRIHDGEALLRETCRIAVEHGKFELVWIALIDQEKQRIQAVAWAGFSSETAHQMTWKNLDIPGTTLAEVLRTLKVAVRDDIDAGLPAGVLRQEAMKKGHRSTVCVPFMVDGVVVAAIILFAPGKEFFDPEELALLNEVAGNVSLALQAIQKQEKLEYLSYYDVLTGLANRTLFLERVASYMRSAASSGHKLPLFLIDLERFKNINDSLGQPAGDALLKQVAEWLTRHLGDANLVARVGADHFAVVLPQAKREGSVARFLEKMIEAFLEHPFRLNDAVFRIAAKIGAACSPDDGADADTLFRNAEAALKKAKAGGERFLFYTQKMTATVAARLTLENQLRQALDREEFVLHYQPKVTLESATLTGAEALIRWNDPKTGLVPPGSFIPVLEETGLIYEVGRWALRKAIADYLRWRAAGMPAVRIAVNVSPLQLRNRGFIAEIAQIVGINTHAAAGLELEITESLIMEDVKHSIAALQAIRAMGVRIAIDDFGTGFSSLSYLSKLPVDSLKIDRSFVMDMTAGPEGLALVSTIINLAHSLKLTVVAEGVETEEQSRLLRLLDCDEMQGFLFSKPVPGEMFESRYLALPLAA